MKHWTDKWAKKGACQYGLGLARKYPTQQAWWRRTRQGSHMAWLINTIGFPTFEFDISGPRGAATLRKMCPDFPTKRRLEKAGFTQYGDV